MQLHDVGVMYWLNCYVGSWSTQLHKGTPDVRPSLCHAEFLSAAQQRTITWHAHMECFRHSRNIDLLSLSLSVLWLASGCTTSAHSSRSHLLVRHHGQISTTQCSWLTLINCTHKHCTKWISSWLNQWHLLWLTNVSVGWKICMTNFF